MTPSCRLSTPSSGQGPGFEWQGSVRSDWPHSSLRPPCSTAPQGGSGCCSSCSGRRSPGPPGCLTPLRSCCCPPPSSPGSRPRGSPRWPDTPEWHCPAAALHWRGGGRSGWAAPHPLEEREGGEKTKGWGWSKMTSRWFLARYKIKQKNFYCLTSSLSVRPSAAGFKCQCGWEGSLIMIIDDYWWRLHVCFSTCDSEELVPEMIFFCLKSQSWNTGVKTVQTVVVCFFHFLFTTWTVNTKLSCIYW